MAFVPAQNGTAPGARAECEIRATPVTSQGNGQSSEAAALQLMAPTISRPIFLGALRFLNFAIIVVSGIAAHLLNGGATAFWPVVVGAIVATAAVPLACRLGSGVLPGGQAKAELSCTFMTVTLAIVLFGGLSLLTAESPSIDTVLTSHGLWLAGAALGVLIVYLAGSFLIAHWDRAGAWRPKLVVVGPEPAVYNTVRQLNAVGGEFTVAGVFVDKVSDRLVSLCGEGRLAPEDAAYEFCRDNPVDRVVLASRERTCVNPLSHALAALALDLDVAVGDRQVTILNVARRPFADWEGMAKAVEDRLVAAVVLFLIGPILAVISILVKLDSPGPVMFRQPRAGLEDKEFQIIKFRSMTDDPTSYDGARQTTREDKRITRVGSFLRRTSLDELPQFWNVLRGEMSVVGPRPHPPAMLTEGKLCHEIVPEYARRHRVKPGMTGWAQINGFRGATHTTAQLRARVEHDLFYIDHWSLRLDIRIIWQTIVIGFTDKQAY